MNETMNGTMNNSGESDRASPLPLVDLVPADLMPMALVPAILSPKLAPSALPAVIASGLGALLLGGSLLAAAQLNEDPDPDMDGVFSTAEEYFIESLDYNEANSDAEHGIFHGRAQTFTSKWDGVITKISLPLYCDQTFSANYDIIVSLHTTSDPLVNKPNASNNVASAKVAGNMIQPPFVERRSFKNFTFPETRQHTVNKGDKLTIFVSAPSAPVQSNGLKAALCRWVTGQKTYAGGKAYSRSRTEAGEPGEWEAVLLPAFPTETERGTAGNLPFAVITQQATADNCSEIANSDQSNLYSTSTTGNPTACSISTDENCTDTVGDACDNSDGDLHSVAGDMHSIGDPIYDREDNCPLISNPTQADTDGDGIGDLCEDEADGDGDGVPDAADKCLSSPRGERVTMAGDNDVNALKVGCSDSEFDTDGDGDYDNADNCLTTANPKQTNTDGDSLGDACDPDDDNDEVLDAADNCPGTRADATAIMAGDADVIAEQIGCASHQIDTDGDMIFDDVDNCINTPNYNQFDRRDGGVTDGVGDICADSDGDGVNDYKDRCPFMYFGEPDTAGAVNEFGCKPGQREDIDSDNDGIKDPVDNCSFTPTTNSEQGDRDDNGIGDACDDRDDDGVIDVDDNCPDDFNPLVLGEQGDRDDNGIGDACEAASDFCFPVMGDNNTAVVCL